MQHLNEDGFCTRARARLVARVVFVFSMVIMLGWPLKAVGGTFSAEAMRMSPVNGFKQIKAIKKPSIGSRCVRTRQSQGRYELVNLCALCRSVQIQHSRPNNRPAILRDYYVPPSGTIRLPFRGKGRTRVLSDTPCESNDKRAKSAEKSSQACVRMRRDAKGLVLINVCTICKAGIIERSFRGGTRKQQTLAINSKGLTPVSPNGAQSARLVSEVPCR